MDNFSISRKIFDSWIFADEKAFKIFVWLIGKARYKKGFINVVCGKGNESIELNRGQLLFGRFKAEEQLNLDGSLIYRKLQKMVENKEIIIESNNHYSIITLVNYDSYQYSIEQPTNSQQTANEQPTDSQRTQEKKVNTVKKVNKVFVAPTLDEVKEYFKEKGYNEKIAIQMYDSYNVADWIDSQGNPVKNWKQKAINVWFKENNKINPVPAKSELTRLCKYRVHDNEKTLEYRVYKQELECYGPEVCIFIKYI